MNESMTKWGDVGFLPADILLPKEGIDMTKWAVVACDQFSSEPEYWTAVEKTVGEAPSPPAFSDASRKSTTPWRSTSAAVCSVRLKTR